MSTFGRLGTRLWSSYVRALDTRPLLTKSCTSFSGFIIGDSIAQYTTQPKYDALRTARFATYGFFIHGPLCHYLYNLLDKVWPDSSLVRVRQYCLLDTDNLWAAKWLAWQ